MSDTPKVNLVINQGATFRHRFAWRDKNGRPIDVTGFTARMQIRADAAASAALVTLTTENGGIALGGKAGTVALYLNDTNTSAITWNKGVYDIQLVSPSGDVFRMVGGIVTVSAATTKS
jgi:PIN domain nuclease of toxin-antitoxin system